LTASKKESKGLHKFLLSFKREPAAEIDHQFCYETDRRLKTMSKKHLAAFAVMSLLSAGVNLAASASDEEVVKVRQNGAPTAVERTTTTSDSPTVIQDDLGGTTVVPGSSTTTTTTDVAPGSGNTTMVERKKKASHHLINLFGVKVL
jgi:hypothetical protein